MFYKFMGGDDEALLKVFDAAVVGGSLKFGAATDFNDPFEFKFVSHPPTRDQFDSWHAVYEPGRTPDELKNAWESFSGPASDWNTCQVPRMNLLEQSYVLCLARRWDSHLMWAHYSSAHHGFAVRYRPEIIDVLRSLDGYGGDGDVTYSSAVPEYHWFTQSPEKSVGALLSTKSNEWQYEGEYRVVFCGEAGKNGLYRSIDPKLIDGVIFGTRAKCSLIDKALALQDERSDFQVEQVVSDSSSYEMKTRSLVANVLLMTGML